MKNTRSQNKIVGQVTSEGKRINLSPLHAPLPPLLQFARSVEVQIIIFVVEIVVLQGLSLQTSAGVGAAEIKSS